jgi:hypothetical protein
MKKQKDFGCIAAGNYREFACDAVSGKMFDRHVGGDRPDGANFLNALAAFCPTDRPRLCG